MAVADWVSTTGKNLTTVYVTHGHGDHWFGRGAVRERFPGVLAVATPAVVEGMRKWSSPGTKRTGKRARMLPGCGGKSKVRDVCQRAESEKSMMKSRWGTPRPGNVLQQRGKPPAGRLVGPRERGSSGSGMGSQGAHWPAVWPRRAAWVRAAAMRLARGCEGSSSYPVRAAGSGRNLGSGKASSW